MSARQARVSSSAILAVLCTFVLPARLAAQCTTGNCGSMMTGRTDDQAAARTVDAPAGETASAAPGAESEALAAKIWDSRCAACHGAEGRGDGPGAAALKPKPVNFHKRAWQKSVPDDQIAKAIVEGGGAVGKSNQMPPNPDLEDEPGIVKALVAHVRALGK